MTVGEIKAALSELVSAMVGKGVALPEAHYIVKANETNRVYLKSWAALFTKDGKDFAFCKSDDPAEAIAMAWEVVNAIPSADDRDKREFLSKVSEAAARGRKIGLDHKTYIAPLRGVAQAVSENLLTDEVAE